MDWTSTFRASTGLRRGRGNDPRRCSVTWFGAALWNNECHQIAVLLLPPSQVLDVLGDRAALADGSRVTAA